MNGTPPSPTDPHRDLLEQFEALETWLGALEAAHDDAAWQRPPATGGWSAVECLEHLATTAEVGAELLRTAAQAPGHTLRSEGPRLLVRFFLRMLEPPVRLLRARTTRAFVPPAETSPERARARFRDAHAAFASALTSVPQADRLRACIRSPFAPIRYTPREWGLVVAAHARRHLWQAERALKG
jgi:hypothetical protein